MAIPINIEDLLNKQRIESNEGRGNTVILNIPNGVTHELGSRLGSAVIGKLKQSIKTSDNGGTP